MNLELLTTTTFMISTCLSHSVWIRSAGDETEAKPNQDHGNQKKQQPAWTKA